jgi:hypothetical protein
VRDTREPTHAKGRRVTPFQPCLPPDTQIFQAWKNEERWRNSADHGVMSPWIAMLFVSAVTAFVAVPTADLTGGWSFWAGVALAGISSAAYAVARAWPAAKAALVGLVGAAATTVFFGPALAFWLWVAYALANGEEPPWGVTAADLGIVASADR